MDTALPCRIGCTRLPACRSFPRRQATSGYRPGGSPLQLTLRPFFLAPFRFARLQAEVSPSLREGSLEEFGACWEGLEDPRTGNAALHEFHDLLMIALCTVLCSGQNATDMAEFAKAKESFLREFLSLRNGLPSHDTFSRLFRLLDPVKFGAAFQRFMAAFSRQTNGVARPCSVIKESMMVAWLSASKSVQSMATSSEVRAPITNGTQSARI